jgi:hypothetical protein
MESFRAKKSETRKAWIDDAIDSDLIPIMRFARILRRDIGAVYNDRASLEQWPG